MGRAAESKRGRKRHLWALPMVKVTIRPERVSPAQQAAWAKLWGKLLAKNEKAAAGAGNTSEAPVRNEGNERYQQ